MHLKERIRHNFLIVFAVTLVSAGLVFATAGVQAEPEGTVRPEAAAAAQAVVEPAPVARMAEPEAAAAPEATAAPQAEASAVPKTAKARALADALENGEPMPPAVPVQKTSAEESAEPGVPDNLTLLDTFIATAYCLTGTTSTGTYTTVGRTLAVNPGIIPYGTHVWLYLEDGTFVGDFYAEDTGANMMEHPYVVDIYMGEDSYNDCINWGARRVSIYVEGE